MLICARIALATEVLLGRPCSLTDAQRREIAETVRSARKTAADITRLSNVRPATISRVVEACNPRIETWDRSCIEIPRAISAYVAFLEQSRHQLSHPGPELTLVPTFREIFDFGNEQG